MSSIATGCSPLAARIAEILGLERVSHLSININATEAITVNARFYMTEDQAEALGEALLNERLTAVDKEYFLLREESADN